MAAPPSPRGARLEAGACLVGKYRLVRRLASGGMGQVWCARNETTGADVALKVLHEAHDEALDARFRNEARLGAMLSHRSIVRIFDLIEGAGGELVLVMELLRGESLAGYLKRTGTISTREAVAIAVPVLSALAHAHESGVVHRDVTPGNVFLAVDPDGQVIPKLVDFGIAKLPVAGSLTLEGRVLGTPRYMSPEQIRAASDLDGRSDLFSLAATLYEAIAGASPFAAPTPGASLAAVLESTVDPDPRIDPRVWIELERALGKRPYERHRDAREMADALRGALGESEASLASLLRRDPPIRDEDPHVDASPEASPEGTVDGQSLDSPRGKRSRRRLAVVLGAAVGLVGVVGWGALGISGPARNGRATAAQGAASPVTPPSAPGGDRASDATGPAAAGPAIAPIDVATGVLAPVVAPIVPALPSRKSRPAAGTKPHPKPVATTPGF
jgi:serine/threonine-protein kinase